MSPAPAPSPHPATRSAERPDARSLPPWTGGRMGIVMMSALGDAVHVLPLLDAVKRHASETDLTWILQSGPALMVAGHPHVDRTIIFRRDQGLDAYRAVARELRSHAFDLVMNLQVYLKAGIVTWLARAPIKLGFDFARARDLNWLFTTHRIPPHAPQHVQDQYFEFLDALGVPHGEPRWLLGPSAAERASAQELVRDADGPLVGIVLATSRREKNWIPERWAEVVGRLRRSQGVRSVLLGGSTELEAEAAAGILAATDGEPINTLGQGLRTMIGLLDVCDVVVSPDTGPYHMCVAMGVPAVGLFGYTNPKRVGPYRRFTDLVIDAYGDPGEDYPITIAYRRGRMPRIGVREVVERVRLALERYASGPPWRRERSGAVRIAPKA